MGAIMCLCRERAYKNYRACGRMGPPKIARVHGETVLRLSCCLVDPCELVVEMRVYGEDRNCSESWVYRLSLGDIGIFLDWFSNRKTSVQRVAQILPHKEINFYMVHSRL